MTFAGFPRDTLAFLRELRENNTRGWFEANRGRYERSWKQPALALIDAMAGPVAALDPPLKAEARINGSLRRINRDLRFSADKSPYNAMLHLIFWTGSHPNRSPAVHFVLSPGGLGYGAGVWGLSSGALAAMRARICDAAERRDLLDALGEAAAIGCHLDPPDLARLPKGFEAEGDWEHLLRRKSLVVRTGESMPAPDWLHSPDCAAQMTDLARALVPLAGWLARPG